MNGETSHQQTDSGSGSFYPLAAEKEKAGFQTLIKRFFGFLFPEHLVCHCCNREAVVNEYMQGLRGDAEISVDTGGYPKY